VLRDLDRRERAAHARLSELSSPLAPPASLAAARDDVVKSGERRQRLLEEQRDAAASLEALTASRPVGIWSWLSGATRAHDARVAQVKEAVLRSEETAWLATVGFQAAESRLYTEERSWAREGRRLEAMRAEERRRLKAALVWIADARVGLVRDPDLAFDPSRLPEAVDAVRLARRGREGRAPLVFRTRAPRPR
jgi:hypothetical protein